MAKKRVHEIAKERGISSKEVIAVLQRAGLDVKAAAQSIDENDIAMAFGNGDGRKAEKQPAETPPAASPPPAPSSGAPQSPGRQPERPSRPTRCIPPRDGYLQRLRELTKEHGVLLIFDEVVTGFRYGPGGCQELFGIRPDLSTFGKAMGAGFPVGAVAGSRAILDQMRWSEGEQPTSTLPEQRKRGCWRRSSRATVRRSGLPGCRARCAAARSARPS